MSVPIRRGLNQTVQCSAVQCGTVLDSGCATVKMMLPHTLMRMFFIILVQKELSNALEDKFFRPTPIPLNDWYHERRQTRAGTLHEAVVTAATPAVVAMPAHYWEDALRHSVYLTLVRDKIDQLIARGDVYPQTKHGQYSSKEVDDQDLWDKIKNAPFDRLQAEEPTSTGDVTIMAKGRLIENNGRFQFIEDERTQESCGDDKCMNGVKAFWSVKRVRQRDVETSPGRYHYELTFSVATNQHKKERKPYEKPVRMFTVQETTSEKATYKHNQHENYHEKPKTHTPRGERTIWFHKNIAPTTPRYESRQYDGFDRIFSSLFDDYDEAPPQRSKLIPYLSQSHTGTSNEYYQQKKLTPFPYKPHSIKYFRPPVPPPPLTYSQNHYLDIDNPGNLGNQYIPQPTDNRYITSYKTSKIQRPAFLPTLPPSVPIVPPKTTDVISKKMFNTDNSTSTPEFITAHNSFKPYTTPPRMDYFSEHVRPPVYNAPPGVFQNLDKKPFKPMPPFKFIHSSKPIRANRPTDFRPSPQLLDIQFSEPDPLFDNAFRPITVKYSFENTTAETEAANENTDDIQVRKPDLSAKKHEHMKPQVVTTPSPEIITAHSNSLEENVDDPMLLASILDALTKTSPMMSQTSQAEKIKEVADSTTPMPHSSTTTVSTTTAKRRTTTKTTAATTRTTTTTTTLRPKKRTRPPPKFTKSEKVKKHKRITSTTVVTPVEKLKSEIDLTPQASNSPGTTSKPWKDIKNTTTTTTSPSSTTAVTSTTTPTPHITTITTTTTTHPTNPTTETYDMFKTTQPKNKNRYRQSTLMYKGTSVKHDRWSTSTGENPTHKGRKNVPSTEKQSPRRKGSNFQGYIPSSTPVISDIDRNREVHLDSVTQSNTPQYSVEITTAKLQSTLKTTSFEETNGHKNNYEMKNSQSALDLGAKREDYNDAKEEFSNEDEESDHIEIIQVTTDAPSDQEDILSKPETTTEQIVITSPLSATKNKTKCKKKKHQNLTNNTSIDSQSFNSNQVEPELITSPASIPTTTQIHSDIFDDIFGGFTDDYRDNKDTKPNATESTPKPELEEGESEHHERYVKIDDNFDDLYDSLNNRENETDEEMYEDVNERELSSDESYEDNKERSSNTSDYEETEEKPFSLLELIQGLD